MRRRSLLPLAVLALTGACTTISPEELRGRDEASCRSYGFRAGTDAFAECLQRLDLDRRADRRAFAARDPWLTDPWPYRAPGIVWR